MDLCRLGSDLPTETAISLVDQLTPFVIVDDFTNLAPSLNLLTVIISIQPAAKPSLESLMSTLFDLTRSPMFGGAALDALLDFFGTLARLDSDAVPGILDALMKPFSQAKSIPDSTSGEIQGFKTVAKCIGALMTSSPSHVPDVTTGFAANINVSVKSIPLSVS